MVMIEIDSNVILVDPIKSCKDEDLTRAYGIMMLRLRRAGIIPKNHIMDNKVSDSPKTIIQDEYKMQMELVTSGTHLRNAAEASIRNFKAHFLSVFAGTAQDFPPSLWLLPQD